MSPALAYFCSCIIFSFSLTKHILAAQTFSPVNTHKVPIVYPSPPPASSIQYFCRVYMLSLSTSLPQLLEPATVWFCLILVHHSNILFWHILEIVACSILWLFLSICGHTFITLPTALRSLSCARPIPGFFLLILKFPRTQFLSFVRDKSFILSDSQISVRNSWLWHPLFAFSTWMAFSSFQNELFFLCCSSL